MTHLKYRNAPPVRYNPLKLEVRFCVRGVISPLLANLYLHELDVEMREAGLVMVRYADDAVVLCHSLEQAQAALARLRTWVTANGLTLHPDKTHVGDCRVAGQGFEFLGYRFEAGQRWVRKKSLVSLRDKIRATTKPSVVALSLA